MSCTVRDIIQARVLFIMVQTGDSSSQKALCCSPGEIKTHLLRPFSTRLSREHFHKLVCKFWLGLKVIDSCVLKFLSFERRVDAGIAFT